MAAKMLSGGALLLLSAIVSGCATPNVEPSVRTQAGATLGGDWTRTPQDLANPQVQSATARFDRTTGDGAIGYKAGHTNTLQLRGATGDGGFRYYDSNASGGIPIEYVCRANNVELNCRGQFQGGNMSTFTARFVRPN
jgi:hypothetical protein